MLCVRKEGNFLAALSFTIKSYYTLRERTQFLSEERSSWGSYRSSRLNQGARAFLGLCPSLDYSQTRRLCNFSIPALLVGDGGGFSKKKQPLGCFVFRILLNGVRRLKIGFCQVK